MDDIAEANELHEEISDVISAPTGFGQDVDEVSIVKLVVSYDHKLFSVLFMLYEHCSSENFHTLSCPLPTTKVRVLGFQISSP